jgi:hypothetical protein
VAFCRCTQKVSTIPEVVSTRYWCTMVMV